jgi:hypothetical protein
MQIIGLERIYPSVNFLNFKDVIVSTFMGPLLPDEELHRRRSPIEMDANAFREAGHRLIDDIAGFLSSISDFPVTTAPTPRSLQVKLPNSLPLTGSDPSLLTRETWQGGKEG